MWLETTTTAHGAALSNMVVSTLHFSSLPCLGQHHVQGEVQPGEQLLQKALDVWRGPSMIITGDDDPTIPTQVHP